MIFTSVDDFCLHNNPLKGELLGLDVGTKKTGVAVSVYNRAMAVPSLIIHESKKEVLVHKIIDALKEKDCTHIVIGFPFGWEEGTSAKWIMQIANSLSNLNISVLLYDEGRTSVNVKSVIYEENGKMTKKQMQKYDAQVASLILLNALTEINNYK